MTEKIMDKHVIGESNFIICELCGKEVNKIDKRHLNTHEEKIDLDKYIQLFPNSPTITRERYNKELESIKKRKESKDNTKTKITNCKYFIECNNQVEVNKNVGDITVVCKECRDNGKEVPISKRMKNTNEKVKIKYNVNNISELNSVKQSKEETREKNKENDPDYDKKIQKKREESMEKRFGPDYKNIVNELSIQGMLKKFGVSSSYHIPGVSEKIIKKSKETKKKQLKERIKKILEVLQLKILDNYEKASDKCRFQCLVCDRIFHKYIYELNVSKEFCPNCKTSLKSVGQHEVYEFVKNLGFYVDKDTRSIIAPLELDVYVPDKKIAIEYNGLYNHSEEFKDKHYHSNKTNLCKEKEIRLIHIFEDEWLQKKDIVKERLKYILGCSNASIISARDCYIEEISNELKNQFLYDFHIQGPDVSGTRLGLYHNNTLVSVMTFQKKNKDRLDFKLNRFCTDYNYIVNGGAGKLFSYFKKNYSWESIITYADLRWSYNGNLYYNLGFYFDGVTKEDYWYTNSLHRINRLILRKTKDDPKDIPEHELRKKEGYYRIWGCGSIRFKMINKNTNYNNNYFSELDEDYDNEPLYVKIDKNELKKETKIVKCLYCGNEITRTKYESNKYVCNDCFLKGYKEQDKRKSTESKQKRIDTNLMRHGAPNVKQVKEFNDKSKQTSNEKGGIGFANPETNIKIRNYLIETTGCDNIMKTEKMRNQFSKPRSEETKRRISEAKKGNPSKLKGRTYEETMGEEKAEQVKDSKRNKGIDQYYHEVMNRLELMNLEFLDDEYKGIKHEHNFKCKICGKEFSCKYSVLKRRYKSCGNKKCSNINPKRID